LHTADAIFDHKTSGAEWWTQVIDSRDDIGFHWDRDYGLEETTGLHIHPHLATVTYLTNFGGPTIVLNKVGTRRTKDDLSGGADDMIISRPIFGKHIKFDGRLLHAAPSDLLEEEDSDAEDDDDNSESESSSDDGNDNDSRSGDNDSIDDINVPNDIDKNEIINDKDNDSDSEDSNSDEGSPKRITFLVNIWLNHMPIQSKLFPEVRLKDLKSNLLLSSSSSYFQVQNNIDSNNKVIPECPSSSESKEFCSMISKTVSSVTLESQFSKPSEIESIKLHISPSLYQERIWKFLNGGRKYQITIPLPFAEQFHALTQEYDAFKLTYNTSYMKNARVERITRSKKIADFNVDDNKAASLNVNDVIEKTVNETDLKPLSEREERRKRLRDASLKPAH